MRAFTLAHPRDAAEAQRDLATPDAIYIGGGTDLMQLMKNDVTRPAQVVDLAAVTDARIAVSDGELRLGARATMAEVAGHPEVVRRFPVLSQALLLSASQQVRNMATVGGNLLQRTRCNYFRDPGFAACNKRNPGSGCSAISAHDRRDFAIFGTSDHCIALHASDMAVALTALDASLELQAPGGGTRRLTLAAFYQLPGDTPHIENALQPGEIIAAIVVPVTAAAQRSVYLKVRDRSSFAFALVSAAVGVELEDGKIKEARVALGGVGTKPWRVPELEAALRGQPLTGSLFRDAAQAALKSPDPDAHFKYVLAQRVAVRALQTVSA